MILRPYQSAAIRAVYAHLEERDDNPCVVLPTAAGKTPCIAQLCRDVVGWGGRVLVLAHVKELLAQAHEKIMAMAPELALNVGIYSAGLNSRDTDHEIIIAGIQSVYRKAEALGRFDLILIDEAHLIPGDGDGMYRTFIADARLVNPAVRIVGLTATPYRLGDGLICGPDNILNHVCYEISVRELIVDGYLCNLRSKAGAVEADTAGLHIRGGEFVSGEAEALMDDDELVRRAVEDIIAETRERHSCLIFCTGVDHARHVVEYVRSYGHEAEGVFGESDSVFRAQVIERFKSGDLKYLVNVNVLTLGFDAPNVDCVALLRPTMSPGLYYQMVGRAFRLHPSKADALILDYAGNVERHGPVDRVKPPGEPTGAGGEAPIKKCPQCREFVPAGCLLCPACGYEFPPRVEVKHAPVASTSAPLSGVASEEWFEVRDTFYVKWRKRGDPDAPPTLRVDYEVGFNDIKSEWVCFEHSGYAGDKAAAWWRTRSNAPVPATVDEALDAIDAGLLAVTKGVKVRSVSGEKYERMVEYALGPRPPVDLLREDGTVDISAKTLAIPEDDIPFDLAPQAR